MFVPYEFSLYNTLYLKYLIQKNNRIRSKGHIIAQYFNRPEDANRSSSSRGKRCFEDDILHKRLSQ